MLVVLKKHLLMIKQKKSFNLYQNQLEKILLKKHTLKLFVNGMCFFKILVID
jgi:hypothetical protein